MVKDEIMTIEEVAAYLRLNEKKIYALISAGKLPAARISGKWLFPKHLVDQWVEDRTPWVCPGLGKRYNWRYMARRRMRLNHKGVLWPLL